MAKFQTWICKIAIVLSFALCLLAGIAIHEMARVERALVSQACVIALQRAIPAPNAKNVLVVNEVDCGASTPFSTQIVLLSAGAIFSREGDPPFFVAQGRHQLAVNWIGDSQIEIAVPREVQIFRRDNYSNGISVSYR